MRFVTFRQAGAERAGILRGDGSGAGDTVIDLAHPAFKDALGGVEPQIAALIETGLTALAERLRAAVVPDEARLALGNLRLLAPIPRPRQIIAAALNYVDALAERGMAHPETPVVFLKDPATVVGPGAEVVLPDGVGGVTYEAELAAILGRPASDVTPESALDHVAGYAVFNDVGASEIIRADKSFERGKNYPTFGPFGPYLATADEIPDPQALSVSFEMDGRVLQKGSTADMLFSVAELISALSRKFDLRAGDVVATGTPAGVAPLRSPPTWIKPGSRMRVSVEGLGTLENPVIAGVPADG